MNYSGFSLTREPKGERSSLRREEKEPIHILIAEDDKAFRALLFETLKTPEREIRLAANGKEALEALKTSNFDLLITDIRMPEMGGIELLKEAKKIRSNLLVIIITGYASLETAIQALREGAYDYIRKPFNIEELKVSIENACMRIFLERENQRLLENLKKAYHELKEYKKNEISENLISIKNLLKELEKLANLRKEGFLSIEEYEILKRFLMERIKQNGQF